MLIHVLLRTGLGLFRIKTETLPRTLDTAVYSILGFLFRAGEAISLNVKKPDTFRKPSRGNTWWKMR